jgi:ABC-2 type transport system ATP-binding protein
MGFLVEAEHLYRQFMDKMAVDDVNLRIAAGEIYGLVGPDGAGKTTTLRMLCGAYLPTPFSAFPTRIFIAGFDMLKETELARAQIGYLSQRFSLYEDLTVLENIRFFAELRGLSASEWRPLCMEILDFVGLVEFIDRRAGQLSGGMKQKLGLATALVTRPPVLLLDEPTTGVDPVTRQDFWQLIIRLVSSPQTEGGVCVLISTPYMDEAARCHRIGFLRKGKMISEGTPGQLRHGLKQQIIELRGEPLALLRKIAADDPEVADVRTFGDRLHLRLKESATPSAIERLREAIKQSEGFFIDARSIPPTLEDVFIALANQED